MGLKNLFIVVFLILVKSTIPNQLNSSEGNKNSQHIINTRSASRMLVGSSHPGNIITSLYDVAWDHSTNYCPHGYPNYYDISNKFSPSSTFSFTIKIQNSWSASNSETKALFLLTNEMTNDQKFDILVERGPVSSSQFTISIRVTLGTDTSNTLTFSNVQGAGHTMLFYLSLDYPHLRAAIVIDGVTYLTEETISLTAGNWWTNFVFPTKLIIGSSNRFSPCTSGITEFSAPRYYNGITIPTVSLENMLKNVLWLDDAHKGLVLVPGPKDVSPKYVNDYSGYWPPNLVYKGHIPDSSHNPSVEDQYYKIETEYSGSGVVSSTYLTVETSMDITQMVMYASVKLGATTNGQILLQRSDGTSVDFMVGIKSSEIGRAHV